MIGNPDTSPPFVPLSWQERGKKKEKRGFTPLKRLLLLVVPVQAGIQVVASLPLGER
jgi:hypothetical protein